MFSPKGTIAFVGRRRFVPRHYLDLDPEFNVSVRRAHAHLDKIHGADHLVVERIVKYYAGGGVMQGNLLEDLENGFTQLPVYSLSQRRTRLYFFV